MIRKIIHIEEEKCTGCGACASACHENAIQMVNGKAKLTREDYCDGLGDCLPACPADAIHFEEREAPAYDEAAVLANKARLAAAKELSSNEKNMQQGCPGSRMRTFIRENTLTASDSPAAKSSCLSQWPVQIKLAPVRAPYFSGCDLLIAADCTAYAYAGFHEDFIRGRITLIGCPKLDAVDYADKLSQICAGNDIRSITIVRMEVPCCGGLENAAKKAAAYASSLNGKNIPCRVVTISTDGRILT